MRVVLDTNVIVAAMRSRRGASARLLELLADGTYSIVLSAPLALEYEAVMVRDLVPAFLTPERMDAVVAFLCDVAEKCDPRGGLRPVLPDPDDDFILDLASEARVDYIVTHNTRDLARAEALGFPVVTPAQFLRVLKGLP